MNILLFLSLAVSYSSSGIVLSFVTNLKNINAQIDETINKIYFNGKEYVELIPEAHSFYLSTVSENNTEHNGEYLFLWHTLAALTCIITAGMAAGLTMGLVSLEPFDMEILMQTNEDDCPDDIERAELIKEKACAQKLYPLISRHHLLLVTLLLLNSIANEALPLFLNQMVSPITAVVLSVTAVLLFGEIFPSAIFTGPNQLPIGAFFSPFVHLIIFLLYPISGPLAWILDQFLGEGHKGRYNKAEFKALLNLHDLEANLSECETDNSSKVISNHSNSTPPQERGVISNIKRAIGGGMTREELTIMKGALELHRHTAIDVMTTLDKVFMTPSDLTLDHDGLEKIMVKGHSRILVYDGHPHNIRGMLLVKKLIVVSPEECRPVGSLELLEPLVVGANMSLLDMLYEFSNGKSHLAIVTNDPIKVTSSFRSREQIPVNVHMQGIVTLEDVIEKLIKHEIQDESDQIENLVSIHPSDEFGFPKLLLNKVTSKHKDILKKRHDRIRELTTRSKIYNQTRGGPFMMISDWASKHQQHSDAQLPQTRPHAASFHSMPTIKHPLIPKSPSPQKQISSAIHQYGQGRGYALAKPRIGYSPPSQIIDSVTLSELEEQKQLEHEESKPEIIITPPPFHHN